MRKHLILGGLVALGLTAAVPAMANAGPAPEKRHETRHVEAVRHVEHRDVRRDHVVIEHRDFGRHDFHRGYERDRFIPGRVVVTAPVVVDSGYCNVGVNIDQVPPSVIDAANRLTACSPITGCNYVRVPGGIFYDVHIAQPYNGCQTLRFGVNGGYFGCR